jgi:CheY-like chemotaxis protein
VAQPAPAEKPVDLRGQHVLIVDDNETNRKLLLQYTRGWEMRPWAIENGPSALQALKTAAQVGDPFQLLLLDGRMPGMDGFMLAEQIQRDKALTGVIIMMLTSDGQRGDAARCRDLGIRVYLVKPIRKAELLQAIQAALGRAESAREQVITRHSLREARRQLRILVAEDSAVNQSLMVHLLQKMGHTPVVAASGAEVLALLQKQKFDLVFMDVQMPEMDGFAATGEIRRQEQASGGHLPVIAMTAHALKGDRERCLAAGMDGYIAKPISFAEVEQTMAKFTEGAASAQSAGQ